MKTTFCIFTALLVILIPLYSYAQTSVQFTEHGRYTVAESPQGISAGDLDGDGHLDLVIPCYDSDIAVVLGDGTGAFGAPSFYNGGYRETQTPVLADFNNDGNLDAAISNNDAASFSCLLGNGTGTLTTVYSGSTGSYPHQIKGGDFNADGIPDIASISWLGFRLTVFIGKGDGTFISQQYPMGTNLNGVAAGDFNGDGKTDLVVSVYYSEQIAQFWGNGDGTFTEGDRVSVSNGGHPHFMIAGDFNNDGVDDIAVNVGEVKHISIFMGTASGNLTRKQDITGYTASHNHTALTDLNQDGTLDIAVIDSKSDDLVVLTGNGDGTFSEQFRFDYTDADIKNVGIGDFNGDGLPDIALGMYLSGNDAVSILINKTSTQPSNGAPPLYWTRIADLPGDQHVATAQVIDGYVYLVGGQNPPGPPNYNMMRIYNPHDNSWSSGPSMPTRRYLPGSGVIEYQGKLELYVIGGYSGYSGLSTVERYIDDDWTTPGDGHWESVTSISGNRGHGIMCAVVNNNLYAIGGFYNNDVYYNTNQLYDRENNTWVTKASLPYNMQAGQPAVCGGKIYIFGGHGYQISYNTTLIYDTDLDQWSYGTDVPHRRTYGSAACVGDYIYLIANTGEESNHNIVDVYHPATDMWYTIEDYPGQNCHCPIIAQGDNTVYVLGTSYNEPSKLECWVGTIEGVGPGVAKLAVDAPENAQPGESFWVDIMVQDVQNLFGVSFELSYTQGDYVDVEFVESGDFLGSDIIFYPDTDEEAGKVSVGMSRKAGQGEVDGSGVLVRVQFTSGSETPEGTVVDFSLSEITANDEDGSPLTLTGEGGSTILQSGLTVWPGDTDNDGTVNQADILPLGIYWGSTGPERTGGSNSWTGQPCQPWSPEAATYTDATGDGTVNQADVLPIGLNWGKTRTVSKIAAFKAVNSTGTIKTFPLVEVPVNAGDEFRVEIQVEYVSALFGLSFVLTYDNEDLIEPLTCEQGLFMGDDVVFFQRVDRDTDEVAVGISRKSGQDGLEGSGTVVTVRLKVLPDVVDNTKITLYLKDVVAYDPSGGSISLTIQDGLITGVSDALSAVPEKFELLQNYPNPFNPVTTISFALPHESHVTLVIFNSLGEKVATLTDKKYSAGIQTVEWDAKWLSSGIYFCRIEAGSFVETKKMLLMK